MHRSNNCSGTKRAAAAAANAAPDAAAAAAARPRTEQSKKTGYQSSLQVFFPLDVETGEVLKRTSPNKNNTEKASFVRIHFCINMGQLGPSNGFELGTLEY